MRLHFPLVTAVALALAACESAPPPPGDLPEFGEAFPNLPIPPDGELVSQQGNTDALQLVFESPHAADAVAGLYREQLGAEPWRLVSDTRDTLGTIVLFAEGPKRPLWVRISAADSGRSRIELNGAVPGRDTTYARERKAAADTTNQMRPRIVGPPQTR